MEYILKRSFFELLELLRCFFLTKLFFPTSRIVRFPIRIRGRKFIKWGKNFTTGYNCRLDAFYGYNSEQYLIEIGDNCQLNDNVHIGAIGKVKIGKNVLIASKVFITDHNHGSYGKNDIHVNPTSIPIERDLFYETVIINDNVWIGENVSILPGVIIGEGSIIGTSSVVTCDIPPFTIAVGSPAKVIKRYDFNINQRIRS